MSSSSPKDGSSTATAACMEAAGPPPEEPSTAAGEALSPKAGRMRTRPRKKTKGTYRVHWDEKIIAEHDKERGTRQKIDEPDTPYIRSPQTASDSEGGMVSSDDEHSQHRLSWRADDAVYGDSCPSKVVPVPNPSEQNHIGDVGGGTPKGEVWPEDVANRLNDWVRRKGAHRTGIDSCSLASSDGAIAADEKEFSRQSSACSSRSSSSAPAMRVMVPVSSNESHDGKKADRRISLPEDSAQPKPSSDKFKAKRAQHYNEVAALKAFKQKFGSGINGGESSPESDTSDEDKKESNGDVLTQTNTNTNLNQTLSNHLADKLRVSGSQKQHSSSRKQQLPQDDEGEEDGQQLHAQQSLAGESEHAAQGSQSSRRGSAVSFSGESGGESSEDFRSLRQRHYAGEWHRDRVVPEQISSLETNTNTNLNAGSAASASSSNGSSHHKNPMEAGRPPVHFGGGSETGGCAQSDEFRARRQQHYNEVDAVRRFRQSEAASQEELEESSSADEVEGASAVPAGNLANPMEPREAGVAFQEATDVSPSRPGNEGQARSVAEEAAWRDKRAAHYNEMAAALRNMPPPSDDEDESEDD